MNNYKHSLILARRGFSQYSRALMGAMFNDMLAIMVCVAIWVLSLFLIFNPVFLVAIYCIGGVSLIHAVRQLYFYRKLNNAFVQGGFDLSAPLLGKQNGGTHD